MLLYLRKRTFWQRKWTGSAKSLTVPFCKKVSYFVRVLRTSRKRFRPEPGYWCEFSIYQGRNICNWESMGKETRLDEQSSRGMLFFPTRRAPRVPPGGIIPGAGKSHFVHGPAQSSSGTLLSTTCRAGRMLRQQQSSLCAPAHKKAPGHLRNSPAPHGYG